MYPVNARVRLTHDGIEFENGQTLEAEIKILFPDWVPHDFLTSLPISDSAGFIRTDLTMRNPDYPKIFAAGDVAAVTVPKLGAIGHQQCDIMGRQLAGELGLMLAEDAARHLQPEIFCIGDMGNSQGFYIRSNAWYGGDTQVLEVGHTPYLLKMQYRNLFFRAHGKMPAWVDEVAHLLAEKLVA